MLVSSVFVAHDTAPLGHAASCVCQCLLSVLPVISGTLVTQQAVSVSVCAVCASSEPGTLGHATSCA